MRQLIAAAAQAVCACSRPVWQAMSARHALSAAAALSLAQGSCSDWGETMRRGSSAWQKAARSGVTWFANSVRRRGPCERSEQGPSRRSLLANQVMPG